VRNAWAVPGCEAQWTIFEPLLLLHFLWAHGRDGAPGGAGAGAPVPAAAPAPRDAAAAAAPAPSTAAEVRRSLMRILAAVEEAAAPGDTGDVRLHVHESYAVVAGQRGPNDVQDLLWAVAYIRMALAACADALQRADVAPFV
jgi:hypothetical protein